MRSASAKRQGLKEEDIDEAIANYAMSPRFTAAEKLALRYSELMALNPRYVFYRPIGGDGPIGTEGVALTPERSLAVDPKFVPLGVPLFLDTVDPAGKPLRRLVMAQDTGAAIKGAVRGDFFWGSGEAAFEKAGRMKSPGHYWLLLPRSRSPRLAMAE